MVWLILGISSAFFLGFHEIFKKVSVNGNAVLPVLFYGSLTGAVFFLPFMVLSVAHPHPSDTAFWYLAPVPLKAHTLFVLKSLIVSFAWLFGYFAVKHLPVTLLAPVNASGPVWTILGAMVLYEERLNLLQWAGVVISLIFYYVISFGGNIRGHAGQAGKWMWFALLSILFNSASALLDKYLVTQYDRITMQAFFSLYTAVIFGIIYLVVWKSSAEKLPPFFWRRAIPMIGLFLVVADYFYFYALSVEGSMVSILIIIRRASAVVVFTAGILYFHESNLRRRALALAGILLGVTLVVLGS